MAEGSRNYFQHDDRGDRPIRGGGGGGRSKRNRRKYRTYPAGITVNVSRNDRGRRSGEDFDGDIDMGGVSDLHRERFKPYISRKVNMNRRGNRRDRGGPREIYEAPKSRADGEPHWYKITIFQGRKLTKDYILKTLNSSIELPFIPFNFHYDGHNAAFFVNDFGCAMAIKKLDRAITTPHGTRMNISMKSSDAPTVNLDQNISAKIKDVMSNRYNVATRHLNLAKFHHDEAFKSEGLFVPLYRVPVLSSVVKIIVDNIPEVQSIDLSENKLQTVHPLGALLPKCSNLKALKFKDNRITRVSEFDNLKGMQVEEVILDGNPLCDHFKDQPSYISGVRERFPKVVNLDGHALPPPISFDLGLQEYLPPSKPSYFVSEDVKPIVVAFIEQYYTIFDSKERSSLLEAYHDHATFSLSVARLNPRADTKEFIRFSRNLLKVRDYEGRHRLLKSGRVNIVSLLNQFPQTQHEPSSFTVDVALVLPTVMYFTVFGVFREVMKQGNLSSLKTFTRTFIVVPQGSGFCILNETFFLAGATEEQTRTYKLSDVRKPAENAAVATQAITPSIAPIIKDQQQLVIDFHKQTKMNLEFSEKCLQENDWDFQKAFHVFSELNVRGSIPPEAFL